MEDDNSNSGSSSSEISDSELEERQVKFYSFLKANASSIASNQRVKNPDGSFRCPFCAGKKKQSFKHKDLLQHASGIAASSARKPSLRASHLALSRYLTSDLPDPTATATVTVTVTASSSFDPSPPQSSAPKPDPDPVGNRDPELFVWPWTGILANVPIGEPLQERFAKFKPLEVIPLFVREGQCCAVIMRFNKDWSGFRDAVGFENQFKAMGKGREEWVKGKFEVGKGDLHGWMAREEDFNGEDGVGDYLKRNGKLLTVSEVENEAAKESSRMVNLLASQIEVKNQHLMDMESRYNLSDLSLRRILEDKNRVHMAFNEKMRSMQCEARDSARRVFEENEKLRFELDTKRKEIELRCKELDKLEARNEGEKKKLDEEKEKTEMASMVQKQADEDVLKLIEEQKKEKEIAIAKILQLEKHIDQKQQLELDIEQLKGQLSVLKHLEGDEDVDLHEKMEKLDEKLQQEKEELEALHKSLVKKERESNDELQEARKELLTGLDEVLKSYSVIGIKRMGELEQKPFRTACKKKFQAEDVDIKAVEMCSSWQEELKNPKWHPFKIVDSGGKTEEVIDEDDENLKHLWIEMGDDVYNAVKTALLEMNEYNASGRYVVPELWNFKENRKATVKEVVQYLAKHWRAARNKR